MRINFLLFTLLTALIFSKAFAGGNMPVMFFPIQQQQCDVNSPGLVQKAGSPSGSSVLVANFVNPNTAGNLIVFSVGWGDITTTVLSVSDSAGNIYSLAAGPTRSSTNSIYTYYAKNIAAYAGNNQITVTLSASAPSPWMAANEYTGLDTVNPLDVTAEGALTGQNIVTNSVSTTNACDLLYAASYNDGLAISPGSGYTFTSTLNGEMTEHSVVSSIGTYNASFTQDGSVPVSIQMVAFKKKLGAGPGLASKRFIQSNDDYRTSSTSTITFNNPQTAGNLNLVIVNWGAKTGTVSSISDTMGNTYTLASGPIRSSGLTQYVYYAKNIAAAAAGQNQVTVNLSASKLLTIIVMEYKGLSTTSPLDQVTSATGATTASPSVGPVTTTTANELILGVVYTANNGVSSADPALGYKVDYQNFVRSTLVESKVTSTTGSYSTSATYNDNNVSDWIMHILTFR